jgi:FkbM family methyltransferase
VIGFSRQGVENADFVEHAWQALEDAGYDPRRYAGNIGVFGGVFGSSNLDTTLLQRLHEMGLTGPSLIARTPEMAQHFAVRSLLWGDVDMALTGDPEGAGLTVLKRLEDALADGDTVRSTIPESGVPELPGEPARPWQVLVLSGRTDTDLRTVTDGLAGFLKGQPETSLGDVAWTLQVGRRVFGHRGMLVCRDAEDALAVLEGREAGRLETFAMFAMFGESGGGERRVSFLLPGFGDHYPDMALGLYRDEPVFRRIVDDCCERLIPELGFDLRDELFPGLASGVETAAAPKLDLRSLVRGPAGGGPQKSRLTRMAPVQSAVFVVEYALAQLLMGWGLRPQAMIGYSLGEYTAACLAGVISLGDCLTLVARRARLMEDLPPGGMLAVPLALEQIEPRLRDGLGVAVVNGPALHVVSGPEASVAALEAELTADGVVCRRLLADRAGHSTMMEPIIPRLRELLAGFPLRPPEIPYVSNVTGTWIRPEEATDPEYWIRHLTGRVLFGDGLGRLLATDSVLLEVGPGQSLTSFAKQYPIGAMGAMASLTFATLRSVYNVQPDRAFLLATLGRLWMAGVPIDWAATHTGRRRRIPLPTHPVERQRVGTDPGGRVHVWPNGMRIVAQTRTEAEHFYQDIFEKEIYRRHGIEFRDGACIFDVGANIGSFLLYAHQACRGARIYSFEPAPPLFEKLRRNAALNGIDAQLFNLGISDREGTAELTFYPRSSGMSSFHADKEQEKEILRRMMEKEREAGVAGVDELMGFAEDFLEERFRSETFQCRLRPLSSVIEEEGVSAIDLLKIDVQKAELEVLAGIREEHWPLIGQIVMEVHDLDGRLERIVRLLGERGFRVTVEQDDLLQGSVLYNLFALREGVRARPDRPSLGVRHTPASTDLESALAGIWQRVLRVENLGIDDNFFDLGGTSLQGMQIVKEIKDRLGVDLSPVAVFEAPTLRKLAGYVQPLLAR